MKWRQINKSLVRTEHAFVWLNFLHPYEKESDEWFNTFAVPLAVENINLSLTEAKYYQFYYLYK